MRPLSTFFLLGLAAGILCQTCPSSKDILPCICEYYKYYHQVYVICTNNASLEDVKQALKGMANRKNFALYLYGMKLGNVPSNFFNGSSLSSIDIVNCKLDSLADDMHEPALIGLEDSLQSLAIKSSFTEENVAARLNLGHLRKLRDLILTSNSISEMGNDWFADGFPSLESLSLSRDGIMRLGNRAFAKLNKLKLLQIVGNQFGPIKRSMLPAPADKLEILIVGDNNGSDITEDFLSKMPSLLYVNFQYMEISRLEQNIWEQILEKNMNYIIVNDNPLECDSHMIWMLQFNATKLQTLYGKCKYPEEKNGMEVRDFLNSMRKETCGRFLKRFEPTLDSDFKI